MKRIILVFGLSVIGISVIAQVKPRTGTKPAAKAPVKAPAAAMKTNLDTLSYSFGQSVAGQLKNIDVKDLNYALFRKGVEDGMKGLPSALSPEQMNASLNAHFMAQTIKQASGKKEEGKKFLADNKKRNGVITLPNGLQYEIIKEGNGPVPKITDTVVAHYAGSVLNGQEFDNSYKRGQPLKRQVNGLIQGWTEALLRMPVGSKWKLYIPSELGYGDYGTQDGSIPGGATLIFEMELLELIPDKTSVKQNN
ncbi:MAG: FKBP-type peptidyl-prolyl cis-trans isomerase [Sphingobacteriales bacterium]